MLGLVVFGLRTWMCTMAAPVLAASMQDCAICSGVTGTAGFLPGESAAPVTAHEMITLRCVAACSPGARRDPHTGPGGPMTPTGTIEPQPKPPGQPRSACVAGVNPRPSAARRGSLCALREASANPVLGTNPNCVRGDLGLRRRSPAAGSEGGF